jgi:hypothetical protein
MSESKRSFFSTIPGLITGLAGLLTGIVGLVTVLIQLGVLGDDNGTSSTSATSTTVAGGTSGGGAGGGGAGGGGAPTTEVPRFTVSPATLDFPAGGAREKTVKVTNESDSATLTVQAPQVAGTDRAQFSASSGDCNRPVRAGESCELRVTFSPSGALRQYEAVLRVAAQGARSEEIPIKGTTIL